MVTPETNGEGALTAAAVCGRRTASAPRHHRPAIRKRAARRAPLQITLCALLFALCVLPAAAEIPEPETVFYGRIVNRTTAQEFLVSTGTLQVTVTGDGVAPLVVTAAIQPYAGGKYSYVLRLPHQAKSLDLAVDGESLPLRVNDSGFENSQMRVNGHPARPFGSGVTGFIASQPKRGGVHRLDLEVFNDLEDTDGDGIPDWWEDLHGLDKQDASDALQRWGNNLYTNLEAFQRGLNPQTDDRLPELLTSELEVMENGATGLLPRTVASISTPSQITYRLTQLPEGGALLLRNARPDPRLSHRELKIDDSFSQADVNGGRLEYVHHDATVRATKLGVALTNNNPDLQAVEREIDLVVYSPDATEGRAGETWLRSDTAPAAAPVASRAAADIWRHRATEAFSRDWNGGARLQDWIGAFLLARWHGFTVWDGSLELPVRDLKVPSSGLTAADYKRQFTPLYGPARSHVLFAGHGTSRIEGGMSDDVLVAGRGETRLRGNGGADFFVPSEAVTLIEDFKPGEGDCLDLSPLLKGWPGALADKVQASLNAGNTRLRIPRGGGEVAEVVLQGLDFSLARLETLRRQGRVFTGDLSKPGDAVNRAPVAVADEGFVSGSDPVRIAVLANDRDPDGDALHVTAVTQGEFGSVVLAGNIVLYLPGSAFAGADSFTYTASDGRGGFADGSVRISYPFPAAAGRYMPLIFDEHGAPIGQVQLTLQRSGSFSVTLKLRGVTYSGKGVFAPDGSVRVALKNRGRVIELSLNFDFTDPGYPLSGSIVSVAGEDELTLSVVAANPRLAPAAARRFTLSLDALDALAPLGGHGFAAVALNRNYVARVAGRLADGTAYTGSAVQDSGGGLLWSRNLYRGSGWMVGRLLLAGAAPSGAVTWSKPEGALPAVQATLPATISRYIAPSVAAVSALDFRDPADRRADFSLSGGGLDAPLASELIIARRDAILASNSDLKLRLNRNTGVLAGSIRIGGVNRRIHGVVLQSSDSGRGMFLSGDGSGAALLVPKS